MASGMGIKLGINPLYDKGKKIEKNIKAMTTMKYNVGVGNERYFASELAFNLFILSFLSPTPPPPRGLHFLISR